MLQMNTYKATDLCHLRNVVSPLPGTKMRGLKVRANRTELRLALLERKIQQHELEVAVAIDCCLKKIDERMDAFCAEQKRECILKLDGLLYAKRSSEQVEVDTLLNVHSFAELEEELKQLVQHQLSDLFGIKSVEIAALHPQVIDKPGMLRVASAIVECRRTFFITDTMLKLSNKVWQKSLDSAQIVKPAQKVLGKIELGTVFFEAIDCIPQEQFCQDRQHLAERLKGIVENCSRRLLIGFRAAVAQIFYQIYDDSFAGQFAQQRMLLLEQLKANNRINLSYPSPCIAKQAG